MSEYTDDAAAEGLAEALKFTARQADKAEGAANKVAIVPIPGCPIGDYLIVKPDGEYSLCERSPAPRLHKLISVGEVESYVAMRLEKDEVHGSPSVWYDSSSVVVIINDQDSSQRLDRATVKLEFTPQVKLLYQIAGGRTSSGPVQPQAMRQREFIKLFNRDLRDCLHPDQWMALIKSLRAIDFESTTQTNSAIGRGKESMGMSIKEELKSAAGPIPEEIVLNVPVYNDRSVSTFSHVRCLIEVNTKELTFTLEALAGELDRSIAESVEKIGDVLKSALKDTVPIFCGQP